MTTTTTKRKENFQYSILKTAEEVRAYFDECDFTSPLVFDTETDGLTFGAPLLGISFYQLGKKSVFIATFLNPENPEIFSVIRENYSRFDTIIAHNALYDMVVFRAHEICPIVATEDSMLLVHLYDSNLQKNLEARIQADFKFHKEKFETIVGKKWTKIDWYSEYDSLLETLAEYACEDVYWTYFLWEEYTERLERIDHAYNLYRKVEIPLLRVLCEAKCRGVLIDTDFLRKMETQVVSEIEQITSDIYDLAGATFNLNSPKQKQSVFYEILGLPIYGYTNTGAPSTDVNVMERLAEEGYPIAQKMVDYSALNKLHSSYITSIPALVDDDGRLRGNLNSSGTKTGRFSSNDPNLQNMPNNSEYPVRASFIAPKGKAFVCLDFSQIEPRLMAHMSQDPGLIEIYHKGGDIYQGIANDLGITRKAAKVVVLAISYGLGPEKLARSIGVSVKQAENIINDFYRKYQKFSAWKSYIERKALENLYVKTMFGRIRRFPELARKGNGAAYFGGLRKSFNTVVQGSAADMLKAIMVMLFNHFTEVIPEANAAIVLQVHDELLVECDLDKAELVYKETKRIMETAFDLRVPIVAEGKICFDWSQMKDDSLKEFDVLKRPRKIRTDSILNLYLLQNVFNN